MHTTLDSYQTNELNLLLFPIVFALKSLFLDINNDTPCFYLFIALFLSYIISNIIFNISVSFSL